MSQERIGDADAVVTGGKQAMLANLVRTALVVDDKPRDRSMLATILKKAGVADVREVGTAKDAIAALDHDLDLIILDIILGDLTVIPNSQPIATNPLSSLLLNQYHEALDCLAVLGAAREFCPRALRVITSGCARRWHLAACMEAGADAYVEKGSLSFKLAVEVEALLKRDPFRTACAHQVGRKGLKETLNVVRSEMVGSALDMTRGSKRAAAKLLGIDRAYVRRRAQSRDRDS